MTGGESAVTDRSGSGSCFWKGLARCRSESSVSLKVDLLAFVIGENSLLKKIFVL